MTDAQQAKLDELLAFIWPEQDQARLKVQLLELITETHKRLATERLAQQNADTSQSQWSEKQIVLICYGDHIRSRDPQKTPLQALGEFCRAHFQGEEFAQLTIHLLPIYTSPYKDGGFDIADPFAVNPKIGDLGRCAGNRSTASSRCRFCRQSSIGRFRLVSTLHAG